MSIGYTPHVAAALAGKVQVQHSPAAGGGGADDTPYGKQCIVTLESFLRTADYRKVKWDLITFNFGLLVKSIATENLLENIDGVLRPPRPPAHLPARPPARPPAPRPPISVLAWWQPANSIYADTAALLMTSSHSEGTTWTTARADCILLPITRRSLKRLPTSL